MKPKPYICENMAEFERLVRLFKIDHCDIFNDLELIDRRPKQTFKEYRHLKYKHFFFINDKGYNTIRVMT